ncbi:hypothetical protein DRH14_03515 [Candidatus Shapirobacteria bacterium]|nr:MAG: hypothetical protein DRH14_03515 [Candidatus Shapirobacteria bacterium]
MKNHKNKIVLILIFFLALSFRLYGINWDNGHHLHPDERFLTMVINDISWPDSLSTYLDTNTSLLNPYNHPQYHFFVYGTFPVFLIKFLAVVFKLNSYDKIYLLGRFLSALFDSLNVFSLYFLSRLVLQTKKDNLRHLFPSFVYAFAVLPLQLSHFMAVDTFLNFFILVTFLSLSFYLTNSKIYFLYLSAVFYALAMASKISAVLFAPTIFLFFLAYLFKYKKILRTLLLVVSFGILSFLIFRFFQPYAFISFLKPNPNFVDSLKTLQSFNGMDSYFPPAVQWISRQGISFPLKNIIFWGAGLAFSLIFVIAILNIFLSKKIKLSKLSLVFVFSALWIATFSLFQANQFVTTMRYFLPIYPFLAIFAIYLPQSKLLIKILFAFHFLYFFAFLSIYSRPHSRLQASTWIYQHLPANSVITNEAWDDPLPLNLPRHLSSVYQGKMLSLYDPDAPEKWLKLNPIFKQADYLIMSSNRLWGSIPRLPQRYPQTTKFYQQLFDNQSNFKKLIEINSYPGIALPFLKKCYYFGPTNFPYKENTNEWFTIDNQCLHPGIYIRDDTSEEAFTVYDHPKVLIFKKKK